MRSDARGKGNQRQPNRLYHIPVPINLPARITNSLQKQQESSSKEFRLENSFVGKLLARSLCWMTAEESRLMRLLEKEGLMITPQTVFPPDSMDAIEDDFFTPSEVEGYYSENPDVSSLPAEPHPLLDVIHDLRESIRDTIPPSYANQR